MDEQTLPMCMKCNEGRLVPLSDYGGQGASVHYKAWVCINPGCGFNIKIRNGDIYLNEPITPGGMNSSRGPLVGVVPYFREVPEDFSRRWGGVGLGKRRRIGNLYLFRLS